MSGLPGIAGTLFPGRFLAQEHLATSRPDGSSLERRARRLRTWWLHVERTCGPATGSRTLFEHIARPLFGILGFRVRDCRVEDAGVCARLDTPGDRSAGLLLLPWSARPSTVWRDAWHLSRSIGADWCFVLAPPYLSLVDTRGHAVRRSVDFTLPQTFDHRSVARFCLLTQAAAFDARPDGPAPLEQLLVESVAFQDRVRDDLQAGVVSSIDALTKIVGAHSSRGSDSDRHDQVLTIVYRMLFLLFAESRDLVPRQHGIYGRAYTVASLCEHALARSPSPGLWEGLAAITRLSRVGCHTRELRVSPFNGRLFARASAPSLEPRRPSPRATRESSARDAALQRALIALGSRPGPGGREEISYADLGVEQLGSVYEHILDLSRRKQTGTFYTPQPLAEFVVRRTLAPLVRRCSADAILDLRVVDPSMGSGAFLVAACRYLANAYEDALLLEGRATASEMTDDVRANIRRLVAERCLAGVDANPVAVQLGRLSLWLATLARGKPLGFLDHRLRVGNSLIGAAPADLRRAPGPIRSPARPLPLFHDLELADAMGRVASPLEALTTRRDDTVKDVRAKEAIWQRLVATDSPLDPWRLAASLWCARWFWTRGTPPAPAELRSVIDAVLSRHSSLRGREPAAWIAHARSLALTHNFFHWPIEFAEVFYESDGRPRARAGFDAVIGNPPWEMLRGGDREDLATTRPLLGFVRESGLYPSCDRGHLNLYQPFLERAMSLTRAGGRVGLVLPWGLASDDGAARLRQRLFDATRVDTLVGFDNARGLFPIHRGVRFLAIFASPGDSTHEIAARFGVRTRDELEALPELEPGLGSPAYPIRLTRALVATVGGTTGRIPDIRHAADLTLLARLCREHPSLGDANGWAIRFGRELNATEDRGSFGSDGLPVIEGKHLAPFSVRSTTAMRIAPDVARQLLPDGRFEHARLAYRDVSAVGNRAALIAAIVPADAVTTHTVFCLRTPMPLERQHFLCGVFNSSLMNQVVRLLMGGHVTTSLVEGLPVPVWRASPGQQRIARLAARLAVRDSTKLRTALDAAVRRLYGLHV